MNAEEMKAAMSAEWFKLECEGDVMGELFDERDMQIWMLGFSSGVKAETCDVLNKILSGEYKWPEKK